MSPKMDEVVKGMRPNALAVLQFHWERTPHVSAKWESGVTSHIPKEPIEEAKS